MAKGKNKNKKNKNKNKHKKHDKHDKHSKKDHKSDEEVVDKKKAKEAKEKASEDTKKAAKDTEKKEDKKEATKDEQYVSPFSDDDDHGFGFGDQATDLADLEHMLNVEVDEDFFAEPRFFHTLRRVINVLGIHVTDDAKEDLTGKQLLERNPAYQNLQKQAGVVEEAINRMSETYCNALNRSVIQVGRIAREFDDAIQKVESLRSQVRTIQETIGARRESAARGNQGTGGAAKRGDEEGVGDQQNSVAVTPASQMSLRELWMLKLESEAMLSLIAKLNIVRDAPGKFDDLTASAGGTHHNCRIGAATQCLIEALNTMFSDEMSQIQALEQILENLMIRKTTAEEIIWETLEDVLYLKTSNGHVLKFEIRDEKQLQKDKLRQKLTEGMNTNATTSTPKQQDPTKPTDAASYEVNKEIYNPFHKNFTLLCVEESIETDDVSVHSQGSESTGKDPVEGDEGAASKKDSIHKRSHSMSSGISEDSKDTDGRKKRRTMMIPKEVVESDVDLNSDELKCFDFEAKALSKSIMQERYLPRYKDPVMSMRILVECLVQIGRLHQAEEVLMRDVEMEVKKVFQREQARTFYRLDRRKFSAILASGKDGEDLEDFRRHFTAVLSCYGCIMMRYSHFAQIARSKLMADEELRASLTDPSIPKRAGASDPSTFMQPVLDKAYNVMNIELIGFLRACLQEHLSKGKVKEAPTGGQNAEKKQIFSFGVLEGGSEEQKEEEVKPDAKPDKEKKKEEQKPESEPEEKPEEDDEKAATPKFAEMPIDVFVSTVLFPMTNTTPQIQHALVFRRSIDRFTKINEAMAKELAQASGRTNPPKRRKTDELAVEFLDKAIKDNVIPFIVQEAINGCINAADQEDAFDPPLEPNVYARADKIRPLDVAMVLACQDVMNKTQPLFLAIHRLPPREPTYNECVDVLAFCMDNLVRVIETKVNSICDGTTADELLEGLGDDKGKLAAAFGKREAFVELLKAYEFDLNLMNEVEFLGMDDTAAKSVEAGGTPEKGKIDGDGLPEKGIERDEALLKQEIELLREYLDFLPFHQDALDYDLLTRGGLKEATCLAHSLLKCASMLEMRIKSQAKGSNKLLPDVETLHTNIKKVKAWGIKMAKFCHIEMVLQLIFKMSKICNSTTLCSTGTVRIPSSVNTVAEWIIGTMDYLRESTSNAMACYSLSNFGQYIPACLMSTVRVIAAGEGIVIKKPLTMNGIESLDRSAAVLYKDLKVATGFQGQFFNIQLTALNFERAATFTALMEMSIEELAEYYTTHSQSEEFSDENYELMFRMDGPRRRGDEKQFKKLKNVIKKRKKEKEEKKEH